MGIFDRLFGRKDSLKKEEPSVPPPLRETASPQTLSGMPATTDISDLVTDVSLMPVDPVLGMKLKNRYVIEKELGRGGIGVVYKAVDHDVHDRDVVIKVLLKGTGQDEWLTTKFHHESEALARIDDPGVVKVLDTGTFPDGKPYFVMEFIKGVTLRNKMPSSGMDLKLVARLVQQLGQALSAAHEEGVFHRDLKPENIMLQALKGGGEQAKLIDFGIAKVKDPKDAANTEGSILAGTIMYMAPEQLERGETSAASDIYSLGVIVYEMVTGHRPFHSAAENKFAQIGELRRLQRAGIREVLGTARPDLPKAAQTWLNKVLAFNPQDRPATAREFGDGFSQGVQGLIPGAPISNSDLEAETEVLEGPRTGTGSSYSTKSEMRHTPTSAAALGKLETVGGGMGLGSQFYVERTSDAEFHQAVSEQDSIILIKGARQMGKTSLLARGMQQARKAGTKVVVTDFQELSEESLQAPEAFFLNLAELMVDQLDLDVIPDEFWQAKRGAGVNFKRFIQREVLEKISAPLVWGIDEADRLFTSHFHSEVFGLFRSWHNARALDPTAPWHRLTLVIAYSTEAHLFITDVNQSPFNVGTRIELQDFTLDQITDLNQRYHAPLKDGDEVQRFFNLVGGQPYLVRRGLHEMVSHKLDITAFETQASRDNGPLSDHLSRVLLLVTKDAGLRDSIQAVLQEKSCLSLEHFYRLRSAGIVAGESVSEAHPRCQIYATYLKRHLL
ncbi:MAG: AAA-like domain-containing protein [Blastocatellia bacterium]|nr:AAA-like domain-containing protein [Blastocatellia bacterium]